MALIGLVGLWTFDGAPSGKLKAVELTYGSNDDNTRKDEVDN